MKWDGPLKHATFTNYSVILLEDRQIEGIPNLHGNETYSIAQIVSYHPTEVLRGFYLTYIKPSNLHAAIRDILKRPNGPLLLVVCIFCITISSLLYSLYFKKIIVICFFFFISLKRTMT